MPSVGQGAGIDNAYCIGVDQHAGLIAKITATQDWATQALLQKTYNIPQTVVLKYRQTLKKCDEIILSSV